ncbi:MAG: GH92 family glycosyl hydrolase [Myxococcota bacterium]
MHRLAPSFVAVAVLAACPPAPSPGPEPVADPLDYASPLMGTGGFAYFHGSAFPGACVPHGLVKVGPDTRGPKYGDLPFIHFAGYWAGDDTALGFSHLHLHGAGARDWGTLIVQPVTSSDPQVLTRDGYASRVSKRSEQASPGRYALTLTRWNVDAELTASTHAAHHRYTFAEGASRFVVLDLSRGLGTTSVSEQQLERPDDTTLRGSFLVKGSMSDGYGGNRVFFELRTSTPYTVVQTSQGGDVLELGFAPGTAPLELRVGLSLVSAEGAQRNLAAEMPAFDFAAHLARAEDAWRSRLSRAKVFGGSEEDRATFYSALRLPFLMPTTISDVDGSYVYGGERGQVGAGEVMLSDLSLWDTYRTAHPLYALLAEDTARDAVASLVRMSKSGRGLPRWPMGTGEAGTMVGAPADIVLADAVLRDVPGVDAEAAWQAASAEALGDPARGARAGTARYRALGYVPLEDSSRSVGVTIEYAHADFALAQLGQRLGHATEAAQLATRARGWRKLFDPATKVLRAHHADGTLTGEPYVRDSWNDCAEASALQTTFMPLWDVDGLTQLHGSREALLGELEAFFDASPGEHAKNLAVATEELRWLERYFYWPSNEPDMLAPFLFSRLGRPDLATKWADWARTTFYSAKPDGVPGNDDGGTMGSWYVFAAAGLAPVPGTDLWLVGAPLFPKLELTLPGGTLTIEAKNASPENRFVQAVSLDGEALTTPELPHTRLAAARRLVVELGPTPSSWGR